MNTFKRAVLRVLLISMTTAVLPVMVKASGEVDIKTSEDKSKAVLSFLDLNDKSVTLSIENDDQSVIYYSEFIDNSSEFSQKFDFSKLEDGDYMILANGAGSTIKKQLTIRDSKIVVEEPAKDLAEPLFRVAGKSLLVIHSATGQEEYEINFYGAAGKFFSDTIEDESVSRKYDLSNLPKGSYSVSLVSSEDFHTYRFDLE